MKFLVGQIKTQKEFFFICFFVSLFKRKKQFLNLSSKFFQIVYQINDVNMHKIQLNKFFFKVLIFNEIKVSKEKRNLYNVYKIFLYRKYIRTFLLFNLSDLIFCK